MRHKRCQAWLLLHSILDIQQGFGTTNRGKPQFPLQSQMEVQSFEQKGTWLFYNWPLHCKTSKGWLDVIWLIDLDKRHTFGDCR